MGFYFSVFTIRWRLYDHGMDQTAGEREKNLDIRAIHMWLLSIVVIALALFSEKVYLSNRTDYKKSHSLPAYNL